MKKINKNVINLSVVSAIVLGIFSGCSLRDNPKVEISEKIDKLDLYSEIAKDIKPRKAIETIYISGFTEKKSNLNHEVNNENFITVKLPKSKLLGDLTDIGGYPISVSKHISGKEININSSTISGSTLEVLEKISTASNIFWSLENGIIKLTQINQIVYTFPAMTMDRISEVYNAGETESGNQIILNKDSIFKDLETVISGMVQTKQLSGEVSYEINSNKEKIIQKEKNKSGIKTNELKKQKENKLSTTESLSKSKNISKNGKKINSLELDPNKLMSNSSNVSRKKSKKPGRKEQSSDIKNKLSNISTNDNINSTEKNKKNLKDNIKSDILLNSDKSENKTDTSNSLKSDNIHNKTSKFKVVYNSNNSRIVLSPSSGTVIAYVTPDEEKKLDTILESVMEKMFGNLVQINMYALSVKSEKIKNFNLNVGVGSILAGKTKSLTFGEGGFGYMISGGTTPDPFSLLDISVKYLTEDKDSKILINPKILTLPNIVSRISDTTDLPYLEPETITSATGSNVSYAISYIKQGVNMSVLTNTFDNNIIMALKLGVTQYLGDKTLEAGLLGNYELPISSPKIIQTTLRAKPGDIIVLGGIEKKNLNVSNSEEFLLPIGSGFGDSKEEYVFLVMPTLIKFVVEKDKDKLSALKKLQLSNNINKIKFTKEEFNEIMKEKKNQEKVKTFEEWEKELKKEELIIDKSNEDSDSKTKIIIEKYPKIIVEELVTNEDSIQTKKTLN